MASRVTAPHLDIQRPPSPQDLKMVFEAAVGEIHRTEAPINSRKLQYRVPIVPRATVLGLSRDGAEKRALSDAAKALALLWKV